MKIITVAEQDAEALKITQDSFRAERNALLNKVDIEINKAVDNGLDTTNLRAYRQALRDATLTWTMPTPI